MKAEKDAMRVEQAVLTIAEAVEARGVLLVHDQHLPAATSLIAGEPVPGSWWSHPLGGVIYNALGALEEEFAVCKLINHKLTLIAPRLWPDLVAIGTSRQPWQLKGLTRSEERLLDRVESSPLPVLLDETEARYAGRGLEHKLLVASEEAHTDGGRHLKALLSWRSWMDERGVDPATVPQAGAAQMRFASLVDEWDPEPSFPWPQARS